MKQGLPSVLPTSLARAREHQFFQRPVFWMRQTEVQTVQGTRLRSHRVRQSPGRLAPRPRTWPSWVGPTLPREGLAGSPEADTLTAPLPAPQVAELGPWELAVSLQ